MHIYCCKTQVKGQKHTELCIEEESEASVLLFSLCIEEESEASVLLLSFYCLRVPESKRVASSTLAETVLCQKFLLMNGSDPKK